jgi:hypothetical protein
VLVATLLVMLLMSAIGAAFALVTSSELTIAANFRDGQETLYAANAALERALVDLAAVPDWTQVLDGTVTGTMVDGPPTGTRRLPDGSTLRLPQVASLAGCGRVTPCTNAQWDAIVEDRPWGVNNPRWQLYGYGPLRNVGPPSAVDSPCYVTVLVGDDASETDGNPARDSGPSSPGGGIVMLRAQAFGPRGARRTVQATVERAGVGRVRALAWHEVRN